MMKPVFSINDRVSFTDVAGFVLQGHFGTVTGYASMFPVMYIVQLDKPLTDPDYKGWTGISAHATCIRLLSETEKKRTELLARLAAAGERRDLEECDQIEDELFELLLR